MIANSATAYGARSRPTLQNLLEDETIRRWEPEEDQATSSTSRQLSIPKPRNDDELKEFLAQRLGVVLPSRSVCKGHSNPFAAFSDAFFAKTPVTIWIASRGFGGKTYNMGSLAFAEAVTLRADVTLLGGSGEQSERVHEYLKDFWERPNAPVAALASDASAKRSKLVWGNKVIALTASNKSVSGPHPQRLRVDEVDLVDMKLLDQALGQPMSKRGVDAHVLLSSARYFSDGTLSQLVKRASEKGWGVHEWCWKECVEPHGWLMRSEIERQRNVVTAEMWKVQYDLQEPSPEGRAIDPGKVERMFIGEEIVSTGENFAYREFEPPVEGATYATGADWARSRDFVEIVTLRDDVFPLRLVAYQRFRKRATPYIVAAFDAQVSRYPGVSANDATGGGTYLQDLLDEPSEAFVMVGMRRKNLFVDWIVSVEHEEIVSPKIKALYDQVKFCRNDDLFKVGGHPPDGVVAFSLAHHCSVAGTRPLRVGSQGARKEIPRSVPQLPPVIVQSAAQEQANEPKTAIDRALGFLGSNGSNGNGSK